MNRFEFKLNGQKITANEIDNKLEKSTDLARAQSSLGSIEGNRAGLEAESGGTARPAQRRRQRDEVSRLFFAPGRRLRNDDGRDAQDARRLDGDICVRFTCNCTPGRNTSSRRNIISRCRKKFRRTGSIIAGHRNGRAWSKRRTSTSISKAENRNGSSRRPNNFTPGSGSRRYRKVSGKNRICIRFRLIRSARKTRTPHAGISILRTTFAPCKASSRTRDGFSPRIMSSGMVTTSRLTRGRRFRICLRLGATPGFHEGVGELVSLASSQVPYLQSRGVLPARIQGGQDRVPSG